MKKTLFFVGSAILIVLPYLGLYLKCKDTDELVEICRNKDHDILLMEKLAKREHLKIIKNDTELLAATLAWLDSLNRTTKLLDIIECTEDDSFWQCDDDEDRTENDDGAYYANGDVWALKMVLDEDRDKKNEAYRIVSDLIYKAPISVLDVNIDNCV